MLLWVLITIQLSSFYGRTVVYLFSTWTDKIKMNCKKGRNRQKKAMRINCKVRKWTTYSEKSTSCLFVEVFEWLTCMRQVMLVYSVHTHYIPKQIINKQRLMSNFHEFDLFVSTIIYTDQMDNINRLIRLFTSQVDGELQMEKLNVFCVQKMSTMSNIHN